MESKTKCCKDYYCGFPAWTGTTCIWCGADCSNCLIGEKLKEVK